VDDASSIVDEDDKDEQYFKPNRVDAEKVDGSKLSSVIHEKRSPRLRWWFATSDQVLATEASEILMPNFISSL
jgi:hypothetical protein